MGQQDALAFDTNSAAETKNMTLPTSINYESIHITWEKEKAKFHFTTLIKINNVLYDALLILIESKIFEVISRELSP